MMMKKKMERVERMSQSTKKTALSCILVVCGLVTIMGCDGPSARRSDSMRTLAYGLGPFDTGGGAEAAQFNLDDFFDGRGRLRDPLVFDDEELWVIARETPHTRDSRDAFSRFGITQDSLNLVDLLGGLTEDSLSGPLGSFMVGNPNLSIWDIVEPSGGIVGIPMDWKERRDRGESVSVVPVALRHTEVHANVAGYIATVDVQQQFHNPYSGKIEAVYVFPLPQDAAISEFVMTIGDRRIRGIIREKEEAEKIYNEARSRGHVASLLSQQRPNIFTQKVANIEPGKQIDIDIRYFHTLAYEDGWYTFAFPMVVGPRFNPGSPAMGIRGFDDPINAISHNARSSSRGTDVRYLKPNERSGHDIALSVNIDAGVGIEEIRCNSHSVDARPTSETGASARLSQHDSIPNKDFVLRWRIAGDRLKTALIAQRDSGARRAGSPSHPEYGHFALMIYPPQDLSSLERAPVEMIFVLDCSGSMKGEPLRIAKRAVERALRKMDGRDTFSIIRFSDRASTLGATPQAATRENITRGLKYLRSLRADGGTHMVEGIKAAIGYPRGGTGFQPVRNDFDDDDRIERWATRDRYIVFLTDGYIANEAEVLAVLHDGVNPRDGLEARPTGRDDRATDGIDIRVFSFGIGSSPNRFLLERMAQVGRGTVAYVDLNGSPDAIMDSFIERASHPALADIEIDFGPMQVGDVFPSRIPDLFVGRPITLTGRFRGETPSELRVRGHAGERIVDLAVAIDPGRRDGIAQVWARQKIAQLMNQSTTDNAFDFANDIRQTALEYGLISAYTSFIAVDSSQRTTGDYGTTVAVPVPVPEGVMYETTVDR